MLVGRAKDLSGSLTTCWIERLENNSQPQTHFNPYLIISIVIPQENHKTENGLVFYDHDNMTSSMRKGSETLSSCGEDLRNSQQLTLTTAFWYGLFSPKGVKQRPQAKASACSPSMQAGLLRAKHSKANPNQRRHQVTAGRNCYPTRQTTAVVALVQFLPYQCEALPPGGLSKACCLKSLAINPLLPARNDETELEVGARSACCTTYWLPRIVCPRSL